MTRSRLLSCAGSVAGTILLPTTGMASIYRPDARIRALWLRFTATNEEVRVPFTRDGRTVWKPGYYALSWLLRDHHVDPSVGYVAISLDLIEALWEMQQVLMSSRIRRPINITSGYRTAATNGRIEGAVKNSQHIEGKAVDLYVDGVSNKDLFDICWSRSITGGDGLYDDHIHVDSGPRRWWNG